MKVYARVAMEFEVDEERFKAQPEKELRDALLNDRAILSDGDNYAPPDWNEGVFEDYEEFGFSLGVHKITVQSTDLLSELITLELDDCLEHDSVELDEKERDEVVNASYLYLVDVLHEVVIDAIYNVKDSPHV